ncbi:BatA and WFA domain-containing protein [Aquimarina sp. U1-2]|uniref:vWA domain-containing protein n=1 Tax=Aquimarina sp. U1-2 TaxID=2823141 RepID=UPI001AEC7412|nr:BatA and WFA domain-containing protein [Aquimarina sp. U1-2]MBP2832719.1 BatA and WFA domain-containing protein [Aquimarina sp. U1-2]
MQFKSPEILYALFALIIPIIVHLFQLRRFKKVRFSNVQFLKAVTIQTRKSSQIKKWVTLITRLLLLASSIIAFAQPYFAAGDAMGKPVETVIYLDNSFSMQAKGSRGPLLKRAVQEILSSLNEEQQFSLLTNTETFVNVSKKDIQNELLQLGYSAHQLPYHAAYLKAKNLLNSSSSETIRRIVMISDFQQKEKNFSLPVDPSTRTDLVHLRPVTKQNIAIDSLFLERNEDNSLQLKVLLSATGKNADNVSIGLYNDHQLLGKTAVSIPENSTAATAFRLDERTQINGKVIIEDPTITFDNSRYFTINAPKKIKVVAINEENDSFLKNIFTPDEFELESNPINALNYNTINDANLLILNEIQQIPASLINALRAFMDQGGTVCVIPSSKGNLSSYQQFITSFSGQKLKQFKTQEKKITGITFDHPLYKGVFDKKISNFQYPKVTSFYTTDASNAILSFEDSQPFLYKTGNCYVFTAAMNANNSNFKNSPLVVPTLYNMGKQSLQLTNISYTIGQRSSYDVTVSLGEDGVLSLVSDLETSIPLQQSFTNKVKITTDKTPSKAGIYSVQRENEIIQYVSYNYASAESEMEYYNLTPQKGYEISDSVSELFESIKEETSSHDLWKWFIIFALLFLLLEILLLKYL